MILSTKEQRYFLMLIMAIITVRLLSLGLYPLYDTTEARYGDMARMMASTNNYLTPMFNELTPFWGKPPLHTWATSISFELFGVHEFSARLPHFAASLVTILFTFSFTKRWFNQSTTIASVLMLCSMIGFIVGGAMVMTDAILMLSITLAMATFWLNYQNKSHVAGVLFFVAMAIGMLVKGPVSVVIIGIALVVWSLYQGCLLPAIKSLPWLSGLLIFSLLTLPWYLMAEQATPGFLHYFLWGEHVLRFIEPGWQGDLYGTAHDEAKGTIWLFWLAMAFPWSFILLATIVKHPKKSVKAVTQRKLQPINSYLLAWAIAPMLLFTLAGNILPAYVMPALPALAILCAQAIKQKQIIKIAATISLLMLITILGYVCSGQWSKISHAQLLKNVPDNQSVYYWQKRPFSASFYSKGNARVVDNFQQLSTLITQRNVLIAVKNSQNEAFSIVMSACTSKMVVRRYSLFHCN